MSQLISLFNSEEQDYLMKMTKSHEDPFYKDLLLFDQELSEYCAWALGQFMGELKTEAMSDTIAKKAKQIVYDLGFEYQWNKVTLSDERKAFHENLYDSLIREGVDFGNIVINKTPVDNLECLLDYGTYCEVFFYDKGIKKELRRFEAVLDAHQYYKTLILSKPEYFITRMHYKDADEKEIALYYAKQLEDDLAYKILDEEIEISDSKTAEHIRKFFWEMVDASAFDYHENQDIGHDAYSCIEDLANTIGGFVMRCGFRYEWYKEELSLQRLEAVEALKNSLKDQACLMDKLIFNESPKEGCYCFLDFGDSVEYFIYRNHEEEQKREFIREKDFPKAIDSFKKWVMEQERC